jgi:galactonate dehydratase
MDSDIEHVWQFIWRLGFYRGGPVFMSAISGIDIALWDLMGRKLGVPVFQLLGGKVRNKVQVYCWIGGDRPSDVEAMAYVFPKEVETGEVQSNKPLI